MSEISSIYFGNKAVQSIETKNGVLYGGDDPFEYEAVSGGYAVTGFKQSLVRKRTYPTNISIPESHNNQPVVEIGENAFSNLNLDQIFIPSSIKKVQREAFCWCYATITLEEDCAFEYLGPNCFSWDHGITRLVVNGIINGYFQNCYDLTAIEGSYTIEGNLDLRGNTKLTSVNLESVTSINGYGMQDVPLTEVNIPNCTSIEARAFYGNTSIKTLYLSTNNIYIEYYAFYGTSITEIHCKSSDFSK